MNKGKMLREEVFYNIEKATDYFNMEMSLGYLPEINLFTAIAKNDAYLITVYDNKKTGSIKITPQGNKYTIVIKEGNQDRWITVDKDTARELISKLGSVLND